MKRPRTAAAIFALAAGAVWVAEVLWLRRALQSGRKPEPEAQRDATTPPRLARSLDSRSAR